MRDLFFIVDLDRYSGASMATLRCACAVFSLLVAFVAAGAAAEKTPLWVYNFQTPQGAVNPTVFFDLVFVPTNTTLHVFRAKSGELVWTFRYPNSDNGGYVAVDSQRVYVGCLSAVYVLTLNGELQWSYVPSAPRPANAGHLRPSLGIEALYVTTGYSPLVKLNPSNGSLVWEAAASLGAAQLHATESPDGKFVYVVSACNGTEVALCLDSASAAYQWNVTNTVTIIVAADVGLLYCQGGNATASTLTAVNLAGGAVNYTLVYSGMQALDYYVNRGDLYVDVGATQAPYPTILSRYDGATGQQLWASQGVSFLFFIPCDKGIVVFGSNSAAAFDKHSGVQKWAFDGTAVNDGAASGDNVIYMITATSVVALSFD